MNTKFSTNKLTQNTALLVGFVCITYLAWTYISHGLGALSVNPGFISLVTGIGFSYGLAKILVFTVGIADMMVALALIAYRKKWVVAYAGIWPLVPFVLGYVSSEVWTTGYLLYPALAAIAYICFFTLQPKSKKEPAAIRGNLE